MRPRQDGEPELEFRLLGPLEVTLGGRAFSLGGANPRALLAVLALDLGRVVALDRLVDDLWGEDAPATAAHAIQVNVSTLRKAFEPAVGRRIIVTRPPGYLLELDPDSVDVHRFQRLAADGRAALADGDPALASRLLQEGLSLWRGPALADFAYEPFAQGEIARLEELRLAALEDRIEADLALGRHDELVGELEGLVAAEPLRERVRGQLMLALYRSGRQADALDSYREARHALVDELGIEPGPALRELEGAILRQDESLMLAGAAAPGAAPAMQFRRLVTMLFVDVVGSLALSETLDPEAMHAVMRRYFDAVSAAVDRHGGTIEKFAGDAVMAAFGVPVAHEDDALRAARAALEIQGAIAGLDERLAVRIGIETGEVLATGERQQQRLVTGDAVGVASRLEQLAAPGEIVVGELAGRLIGHAGRLEPLGKLEIRGKREPLAAFRLLEVADAAPSLERRLDAPLVGRNPELGQLRKALKRAVETRTLGAVSVVGPAGIGKSRLARELMRRARGVTVLSGRCPSYGEGITYWPLRSIVRDAAGGEDAETIAAALAGLDDADAIADRLAGALAGAGAPHPAAEIAWAFRRFCETLAARRPLLLVLDDLHWAEPTLVELVQHLVERGGDHPILVVCLARDELTDEETTVLGERLVLDALSAPETETLLEQLAGGPVPQDERDRIVEAAEGNPLFVEQLLALAAERGLGPERPLPATIQTLLAARLDRLGPGERAVLERGAVVGREFTREEVAALLEPAAGRTVARHLDALARRGFVRPAGDDAFRFRHVLIQEAVYRAAPKRLRAQLHRRFAEQLADVDELVGYHLEQAYRLGAELGDDDQALATEAGSRLGEGGIRAAKRGDISAAVNLLGRSVSLLPENNERRLELLCELGTALKAAGEYERADAVLGEAAERAAARGDSRVEFRAKIEQGWPRVLRGEERAEDFVDLVKRALSVFEKERDDRCLARGWLFLAAVRGTLQSRHADSEEAAVRALRHYRRTGFSSHGCLSLLASALYYGPTEVEVGIARCQRLLADAEGDRSAQADVLPCLACLEAMRGRFGTAREQLARAREIYVELGQRAGLVRDWAVAAAEIELLANEPEKAAALLEDASVAISDDGDTAWAATLDAALAKARYAQGRLEDAVRLASAAMESALTDDVVTASCCRRVKAKALARLGEAVESEQLAQQSIALLASSDQLNERGEALLDLAEVFRRGGRVVEAAAAAEEGLELLRSKGNLVLAERVRAMLAELKAGAIA